MQHVPLTHTFAAIFPRETQLQGVSIQYSSHQRGVCEEEALVTKSAANYDVRKGEVRVYSIGDDRDVVIGNKSTDCRAAAECHRASPTYTEGRKYKRLSQ